MNAYLNLSAKEALTGDTETTSDSHQVRRHADQLGADKMPKFMTKGR